MTSLTEARPIVLGVDGRLQQLREAGAAALEKTEGIAAGRHPRLRIQSVLRDGSPAPLLCGESARAALVVLGTRRLNRLEETLSRYSVTVPVSAQAYRPVVAVRFAADLAARRGAALRALWVRRTPVRPFEPPEGEQETRRRLFEATAGSAADEPDLDLTHEVINGKPVDELARASAHALAVVVGRHGRGGLTGLRLGSVPHGLIRHAPCPVITVPADPGAGAPLTRE
ncbi:universal stress protein [Streptomyces sp. TLI_171]|uniref:universal stress protein n=1 Tax=Streptomyces sp. TLI_171 TaxID=1938859 RepID=UPI000C1911E3|nr:universal stress protein [Streptomyces sp. TLI_171]RKE23622.1 nucleotide-binding universal stress UspA family protein [Streptomyces sp. TLI_171]